MAGWSCFSPCTLRSSTLPTILDHFSENYIRFVCGRLGSGGGALRFCRLSGLGRRAAWRRHFNDGEGAQTWLKGGKRRGRRCPFTHERAWCNPSARATNHPLCQAACFSLSTSLSVHFSPDFMSERKGSFVIFWLLFLFLFNLT